MVERLPLVKIISGGQTGADQAGLRAARRLGLQTGGWAPRGWRTLDGPAPWLADFGLVEHASSYYPPRTSANVRDSDATVRFAADFGSAGERCTAKAIREWGRPKLDLTPAALGVPAAVRLIEFLTLHGVRVLNVAGNSEKTSSGIGARVEEFLFTALADRVCR